MSSIAQPAQPVTVRVRDSYRWLQLLVGIVGMAMIANLQYGWTLFVNPLDAKYHWGRASIQVAFTIFVLLETWLVPIEGYLVDRYGPRLVVLAGGILCGIAWTMNAYADSLTFLYVAAAIGSVGAAAVYGTCVGNALMWFPDRRGLAAGLTAAGFGAGSALTFALAIDRILNGLTRPFFGWVSDNIGREKTMLIAFALEAAGIYALSIYGRDPVIFVILTGLVFFAWGEIYSLFPSSSADTYGTEYATANAGLLYTAKGTASLLVPLSSLLVAATGTWHAVFVVAALMNAAAALMAWFVLKPMRQKFLQKLS